MSFAIIRHIKHKTGSLNLAYRHNERKNTNYSNVDIDKSKGFQNYSIVPCPTTYSNRFNQMRSQFQLKGQIKATSNLACEYLITSDNDFFKEIGPEETKRYFECAYKFVCNYRNLGKEFILSAKVHLDETTPHMHLVYIPVVHTKDKNGNSINKISCSEFWKGKNSYIDLQDKFYSYIKKCGFDLERGRNRENEHIPIEALKVITNHEVQKYELKSQHEEREIESNNINIVKEDYRRVIKKFNTLAKQYTKIKVTCDSTLSELERVKSNYDNLEKEYNKTVKKCHYLKKYISKTFEYISILMNWPIERVRKQIDNFIESFKNEKEKNENEKYNDKERIR